MSAAEAGAGEGRSHSDFAELSASSSLFSDTVIFLSLNGFAQDLSRAPFVLRELYENEELLIAGKRVAYGKEQRTRLHSLAREGDVRRVRVLMKVGANVNAMTKDRSTALYMAIQCGHESVVRLLVEHGADIHAKTNDGSTALYLASRQGHESVVRLLIEHGADINAKTDDGSMAGITALRIAIE